MKSYQPQDEHGNRLLTTVDFQQIEQEFSVDQTYNPSSEKAQSGKAVAEAVKDLATKFELTEHKNDKNVHISEEEREKWNGLTGTADGLSSQLNQHITDTTKHVTPEEKAGWNDKYTKSEVDSKFNAVDDRLENLESIEVDQRYNPYSENAQSGFAVAEAVKDLATKEALATHVNNDDVHVNAEEKIKWNDKYTIHEVDQKLLQLKEQISKDTQTSTGDYATKEALAEHTSDISVHVTVEDKIKWNDKYTIHEVDQKILQLNDRIDPLTRIEVDQNYSPYSNNAQSGHAVADAIEGLVTKETFEKHVTNADLHTSKAEKAEWSDKYTKKEVDEKLAKKIEQDAIADFANRIEDVEDAIAAEALKNLTTAANLATHVSDKDIHVTKDDKAKWNSSLTATNVDQTFKPKSTNPQSGTAVAEAVKDLATKTELSALDTKKADATDVDAIEEKIPSAASPENQLADKAFVQDSIHKNHAHFRGSWDTYAAVPTEPTQYPQDVDGNHKPLKDDYIVIIKDEKHENHTWEYRYTGVWDTNGKEGWQAVYEITSSPLTSDQFAALDSGITKELVEQIGQKANQSDLDTLDSRVDALEAKPDVTVDQTYDAESTNPQSGTAVAEAVEGLATKSELNAHITDSNVHVTVEEKTGWADKYTKTEVDGKLDAIKVTAETNDSNPQPFTSIKFYNIQGSAPELATREDNVLYLEEGAEGDIQVDQTYNAESTNPQSGTAVAEAIKDLVTKTEFSTVSDKVDTLEDTISAEALKNLATEAELKEHKADTSVHVTKELHDKLEQAYSKEELDSKLSDVTDRVENLESTATIDQVFNAQSANAQSGTAVEDAFKKHSVLTDASGTSYMANEKNGGIMKYTKSTGEVGKVTIFDGSDSDHTYIQLVAHNQDKSSIAKINITTTGVYYSKDSSAANVAISDNELVTKKDLKEAADIDALTEHTSNTDIHVTTADKTRWNDKYTKTEVDGKIDAIKVTAETNDASPATFTTIKFYNAQGSAPELATREENVLYLEEGTEKEIIVDQTYSATSENPQSGKAVAEAIKDLATKTELAEKAAQSDLDTLDGRVDALEGKPEPTVDQTYNGESTNAQSGTAVKEAVDALKSTLESEITSKVESMMHYKGQVATEGELPGADQVLGDVYNVEETGANYAWNGTSWDKLSEDISGFATKTELAEKAAQSDLDTLDGRVDALEAKPEPTVDQTYDAESTNAQSGTAVAEAIKDLAKKTDTVIIETNDASPTTFTSIKFYDASGSAPELESREENVLYLDAGIEEPIIIDQTYNAQSTNAQSGKAVAEAIKDLATKTELAEKAAQSDLDTLDGRVDALEGKPEPTVDQTYNGESTNAQSGTAVKEAVDALKSTLEGEITSKVESMMHYKGQVATEGELPGADQVLGDVYNIEETGANYAWNGTSWDKLSEDISGFATKTELTTHTSNSDIHITSAERTKWDAKLDSSAIAEMATQSDVEEVKVTVATNDAAGVTFNSIKFYDASGSAPELATREENVLYLEEGTEKEIIVDQTYSATSENPQSGKAVAEAISTKADTSALNAHTGDQVVHITAAERIKWNAASGDTGEINEKFQQHIENTEIHVTAEKTAEWDAKLDSTAITDMATKTQLATKADQSALTDLTDRVTALEEKPEPTVDQTYDAESTNAQSGTAVAEAIKDLATKTEVTAKADQTNVQSLTERVETLEAVKVDQTYNGESTNAQSGTAVAEAIKDLATKTELAEKAAQSDLDTLDGRVDALEAKPEPTVDQTYNGESTNAQSGTAVKEAIDTTKVSVSANDAAGVTFNSIKFYDASGSAPELESREENVLYLEEGIEKEIIVDQTYSATSENPQSGKAVAEAIKDLATKTEVAAKADTTKLADYVAKEVMGETATLLTQIYAHDSGATTSTRLNVHADAIYYTKNAADNAVTADNEILTKADIKGIASDSTVSDLTDRVEALEGKPEPTVDQTYNEESTNAQSGTAVKEAVDALKSTLESEITSKVESMMHYKGQVATEGELPGADQVLGDVYNVEETGANYAWNGTSWDKLSEDISGFATKTELAEKAAQSDLDTLDGRVDALEAKPEPTVDQTYDAESTNAQSGTAVAGAIKDLATKTELTDLTDRVTAIEEKPEITVDQAYNAESTNAQSGTAVAGAIADLATKTELTAHTGNSEIHVTAEKTAEWDAKLDTSALDTVKVSVDVDNAGGVTFQTIKVYDVEAAPELESREENVLYLDTGIESGSITIQQTYDPASEDAISGKGVAEAIASLATQAALTELEGKIPTVDQTYSATSENAQSGKALASAIAGKANTSDLVQISTDDGAGVVFKSIKYYSSASSAPALEDREDGVLYLIAEEA